MQRMSPRTAPVNPLHLPMFPSSCQVGPNGEPLTGEGAKSPRNKSGAKRRRNGRWSQEETNTLIGLVRQYGKGKWKKILEEGGANFKNRSQARA